jgi:hypothetical protein
MYGFVIVVVVDGVWIGMRCGEESMPSWKSGGFLKRMVQVGRRRGGV